METDKRTIGLRPLPNADPIFIIIVLHFHFIQKHSIVYFAFMLTNIPNMRYVVSK